MQTLLPLEQVSKLGRSFARSRDYDAMGAPFQLAHVMACSVCFGHVAMMSWVRLPHAACTSLVLTLACLCVVR